MTILPMAIAMVAGPQIVSAVVLATSRQARGNSIAFIAGVAGAVLLGVAVAFGLAHLLGATVDSAGGSDSNDWLKYLFSALLAYLAIRTFLKRKTAQPPKWMTSLQEANPRRALKFGFLLFSLMPSDIMVMLSVGGYLAQNDLGYVDALPFVAATVLLVALPFIAYLLLGDKAEEALPRVRDWMNRNSWAITIAVCVYFIYAFLSS